MSRCFLTKNQWLISMIFANIIILRTNYKKKSRYDIQVYVGTMIGGVNVILIPTT